MHVRSLWLTDFRSYGTAEVDFAPGLTAVIGPNGSGKTNLLEALGWLGTLSSFRGAPTEVLVRQGASFAVVRALGERDGRELLLEAQLQASGRNRVLVNRQPLRRARDALGSLRVTVFTPEDLDIVKGGPGDRRRFLDDALVALHPRNDALRAEVDRVLRQRNALLRQIGGRLDDAAATTLDVWDAKLADAGESLAAARIDLLERLGPVVATTYDVLARYPATVSAAYQAPWRARGLAAGLAAARQEDVRRGVSTVGPHRDEVLFTVGGAPARTHASQGEQRSLALSLRLGVHQVVTAAAGSEPVLLLDDVFSELDPDRSAALLAALPRGQTVLTTASSLPPGADPDLTLRLDAGRLAPVGG